MNEFYATWRKPLARALRAEGVTTWHDLAALEMSTLLKHKGVGKWSHDYIGMHLRDQGFWPSTVPKPPEPEPEPIEVKRQRVPVPMIYFVRCGEFVKIGLTVNIRQRLSTVQSFVPYPLTIEHLVRCELGADLPLIEAQFHERFSSLRFRGEWFHYDGALRDFLIAAKMEAA